ncbi:class I SAM-dependent methyltransferase [Maribacter cobaltidurans]|uniref:Methyltransferase n=1 Tax=Maribacter cobaltidurans TaxID=1178778 RepID=A0A223V4K2_9FLAO|nr:class I SAM-dependent methyltransferase [Maribacter cobaltidurans]ASV30226.1 methyltransferase [Maribacter cobaltidurans]GGD76792.1 methyltransferase [Maribacter cobaltidurans]
MKLYLKTKDYFNTHESFDLIYNPELDMLITDPQPKDLDKYYSSDYYISHNDQRKSIIDKIYKYVKDYSLSKKLRLIDSLNTTQKKLLDIGAGTGDFVKTINQNSWKAEGIEPNINARNQAKKKNITLHKDFDTITYDAYDVITLWHVLEHLPDLENQLIKITSLLKKNSFIIVAVPNFKSYDAQHYQKFWAAYDTPRHLWHFSRNSIPALLRKHNMELIETKPMYFDSFYVSLLSEKYKSGKNNYLKGFMLGLISNIKALYTKEYSSLIYILKKTQ